MNYNEFHLTVFDPGGTIGWAKFVVDYRAFSRPEHKILRWIKWWDCGELSGTETAQLEKAVQLVDDSLNDVSYLSSEVVAEDFELTQLIGGKNLLSPVRINAVLEWECYRRSIKFHLQKRQMRTSVTRERLKLFGFEGKFRKDEFAAMQHGIVWLRRLKQQSRLRPWKLSDGTVLNAYWDCSCEKNRKAKCDLIHP